MPRVRVSISLLGESGEPLEFHEKMGLDADVDSVEKAEALQEELLATARDFLVR